MNTRHLQRQTGMSLIEVLVSMVLLSIALLGTAKLTSASLKSTNTSYYRSQATFLADDILDRMRANPVAARTGQYNIDAGGTMAASSGSFAAVDCTEWIAAVAAALPAGVGTVDVDAGRTAAITIQWGDGADTNSFTTVSQL